MCAGTDREVMGPNIVVRCNGPAEKTRFSSLKDSELLLPLLRTERRTACHTGSWPTETLLAVRWRHDATNSTSCSQRIVLALCCLWNAYTAGFCCVHTVLAALLSESCFA